MTSTWELDVRVQALLLACVLAPAFYMAVHGGLLGAAPEAPEISRLARERSGVALLAVVGFQSSLGLAARLSPAAAARWRGAHKVAGVLMMSLIAFHTAGHAGVNLNRLLVTTSMVLLLVAQLGHFAKAGLNAVARRRPEHVLARLDASANTASGRLHRVGLQLHAVLAVLTIVLVAFHVLSFYYF